MISDDANQPPSPGLRAAAEARLVGGVAPEGDAVAVANLVHELQVHQIELEMQNEALRQSQVALEESRDRYADLYEFAPVGYIALAPNGLIAEINLTGAALLATERTKLLQRRFAALVTAADGERWTRHYLGVRQHKRQGIVELALQRGDGTLLDAQLSCSVRMLGSDATALWIAMTDIGARKRAEQEREHGRRRIESLMRNASDCIVMFGADDAIIDVSDSCLDTYGYTRDEMLALRVAELRAPEVDAARQALPPATASGAPAYQTWHRHKDGSRFPVQVGTTRIEVDGSRYYQMIVRDISAHERQREAMENGLAIAARRLNELSRHLIEAQEDARRRLASELHDHTSANLAAILINLGSIDAELSPTATPDLAERLADTRALVEDTDASIREISADLRSPLLDYAGLAAAVEAYALRYTRRTGIAVRVKCAQAATRLTPALESLLFRIFQESLTNSLKHAQAKAINVDIEFAARNVVLTIADDGIGFDPERVGSGSGGVGMGLLNMREMAEFAGGQLSVSARPGAGTRVEARISV